MTELRFQLSALDADATLAEDWRWLEARADAGPFLSWCWIRTWLETLVEDAWVLRIRRNDDLVGLAMLVRRDHWRRGGFRAHSLHLNHTGVESRDQIWPEYNAVLVRPGLEADVHTALFGGLSELMHDWDEFCTAAMRPSTAAYLGGADWLVQEVWQAPTYGVDLAAVRRDGGDYLAGLSAGTRYQLRRSRRRLADLGKLQVTRVEAAAEQGRAFEAIGEWHRRDWGRASGFNNDHFLAFHRRLIANGGADGFVRLHQLWLDDRLIASLYNLRHGRREYFYLGFADRGVDRQGQPGLVLHAAAIEAALADDLVEYDFMGGDQRYKRQLANRRDRLVSLRFKRRHLKFRLEHALRSAKQRCQAALTREGS